jgi:hypothetical protein
MMDGQCKKTMFTLLVASMLFLSMLSFIPAGNAPQNTLMDIQDQEDVESTPPPDIDMRTSWENPDSYGTRSNGEFDMMLKYLDGYGTIMGYFQSIKSADVDNDGEQEMVFGNSEGYIYVLGDSPDGLTEEWKTMVGTYAFGLDLNDVDNDGIIEIVSGNMDGYINIFGFNGTTYIKEWTSHH